ncbi:serine/threonine-protein kinase [Streptomyces goshikiensis]|uniref:serine/threonine-protein kinase n=1 Tax=Streptomyces goshikiensis TaxID=1942 RepID=UPI00365A49AF
MAEYVDASLGLDLAVVAGSALAVRLASLPLLTRAQQAARRRALARRSGAATSPVSAAGLTELALGFAGAVGLVFLMGSDFLDGYHLLLRPVGLGDVEVLAYSFDLGLVAARVCYFGVALLVLALWLRLWLLTRRNLTSVDGSAETWPPAPDRLRLALLLALRVVLGVFLPFGLVVAALLVQAVANLTSRGVRSSEAGIGAEVGAGVGVGAGGEVGGAADAVVAVPLAAVAAAPPAPRTPPATYVPTQADRGAPAAPQIAYQELRPSEPQAIGEYRLLGRIGAGGMGTVYLARREGAVTQVALKTIHPELLHHTELLRRFEREAEVLAMVSGAYTARVLDSGVDAGRPYLAMELLDGRPLDVHLREQGPIRTPGALRALALALAVALSGVHRLGLVHRDLKPANIMLTTAGPRLLDFGIAAIVDGTRLTRTGGGPGTLTYMAPEQFGDERVGPAADVWAWACCVVCAAHGTSPFSATSAGAVIRRIVDTGPEPAALAAVQTLDPSLAAAVGRALAADPAVRPADGAALVELLTAHREAEVREEITRGWRTLSP